MQTSFFGLKKILVQDPDITPISIARYNPRFWGGIPALRALAPTAQMVKAGYPAEDFEKLVLSALDPEQTYETLLTMAEGREPVLLCYEKPPMTETHWCHRHITAEWFERHLGITVPEYQGPNGLGL